MTEGPETQAQNSGSTQVEGVGLWGRLRRNLLTGIVVTAPIAITFYLAWQFISLLDEQANRLIPAAYNPENYLPFSVPGIGLLLIIAALTLIGALAKNYLGRYLLGFGETILRRMPVIRNVYSGLKQVFETVVSQSSSSFEQVVVIEYPRPGLWAIAFVTADTKGEVAERLGDDLLSVFLPTTPNPTSGFLLFVPRRDVTFLDMSVEEGIKLVISAGIVSPEEAVAGATPVQAKDSDTP